MPEFFAAVSTGTTKPSPPEKICSSVCKVHAQIGSTANDGLNAIEKLASLLVEHRLTWSDDLPAILTAYWVDNNPVSSAARSETPADGPTVNVLDLVMVLIEDRIVMTLAERMVCALWTLHTYVYDQFEFTPRLGLTSPASGCGKSTTFKLLKRLIALSWYSHNITAAVIYRQLYRRPRTTFLLDEGENQRLLVDPVLRAVIDCTYESDGSVDRVEKGEPKKFLGFCPIAYAVRGETRDVPLAVLSRSFTINMKRGKAKKRFKKYDPEPLAARAEIEKWAATCSLDPDPEIPATLCRDPRLADNCRPLLAVADNLGRGDEARAAFTELCAGLPPQDPGVQALIDARSVWNTLGSDRVSKSALVEAFVEMGDDFWSCWRGPNDQGQPHKLTGGELSRLLRRFKIYTKTVWPIPRLPTTKSFPGYYRSQFEDAWRTFCPETDTCTQPSRIIALARP